MTTRNTLNPIREHHKSQMRFYIYYIYIKFANRVLLLITNQISHLFTFATKTFLNIIQILLYFFFNQETQILATILNDKFNFKYNIHLICFTVYTGRKNKAHALNQGSESEPINLLCANLLTPPNQKPIIVQLHRLERSHRAGRFLKAV